MIDSRWLLNMAAKEDGCIVSVGGLVTRIKQEEERFMSHVRPTFDNVLLQIEKQDEKREGSIILPSDAQVGEPKIGRVVATGPGRQHDELADLRFPMSVKVGDRVMLNVYSGFAFRERGKDYVMVSDRDILGIISNPQES